MCKDEIFAYARFINCNIEDDRLPIDPCSEKELFQAIQDGVLIRKILLKKGKVEEFGSGNAFENIEIALVQAK